jgi:hypothetical protein
MTMTTHEILHIIRNPRGWSEEEVRQARIAAADLIEQQAAELERLNLSFAQNEQKLSQCHTLMAESVIATYAKDGLYRVTIGVENSEKMHSLLNVLDSIAAADTQ